MKQAEEFLRLFPSPRPITVVLPAIASVIDGRQVFTSYIEQVKQHRLKLYVWSPIRSKAVEIEELYRKLKKYIDGAVVDDLEKERLFIW